MTTPEEIKTEGQEQQENTEQQEVSVPEELTGRPSLLALFKGENPDFEGEEPSDEEMWNFADGYGKKMLSERDKYKADYEGLNNANETFAEALTEYPMFAPLFTAIKEGKSPFFIIGKLFSGMIEDGGETAQEEYDKGKEEFASMRSERQQNFNQFMKDLDDVAVEDELTPEQRQQLEDNILDLGEGIVAFEIPKEMIKTVSAGMFAKETSAAEEEAIRMDERDKILSKQKDGATTSTLPDISGAKTNQVAKPKQDKTPPTQYVDILANSEKIR